MSGKENRSASSYKWGAEVVGKGEGSRRIGTQSNSAGRRRRAQTNESLEFRETY